MTAPLLGYAAAHGRRSLGAEQLRVNPPGLASSPLRYSHRPPPFVAFYRP